MVRTAIKKGGEKGSADSDETYFRITPNEVRLIAHNADKYHQYYPVGFLRMERTSDNVRAGKYKFEPLDLNTGQLVDDYADIKGESLIHYDWVFLIPDDETPSQIEVKQLARADLGDKLVENSVADALKPEMYPLRRYETERATYEVTLTTTGGAAIPEGKVYICKQIVAKKNLASDLDHAGGALDEMLNQIDAGTGGWDKSMRNPVLMEKNQASVLTNIPNNETIDLDRAIPFLLTAQLKGSASQSMVNIPTYIKNTLEGLLSKDGGVLTAKELTKDDKGVVRLENIAPGKYTVFAWGRTDKGIYVWVNDEELKAKSEVKKAFSTENGQNIVLKAEK